MAVSTDVAAHKQMLDIQIRLLNIQVRLESCITENKARERQGYALAYPNFDDLEQESDNLLNELRSLDWS